MFKQDKNKHILFYDKECTQLIGDEINYNYIETNKNKIYCQNTFTDDGLNPDNFDITNYIIYIKNPQSVKQIQQFQPSSANVKMLKNGPSSFSVKMLGDKQEGETQKQVLDTQLKNKKKYINVEIYLIN